MPIKIIKRGGTAMPAPAPIVAPEPPAPPPASQFKSELVCACGKVAMDGIRCKLGATHVAYAEIPRAALPPKTECAFCHKMYLKPCHEGNHKGCANWFAASTAK